MATQFNDWPFKDPINLAVISIRQIVFAKQPILHVTHDADDGGWQFLGAETPSEKDATVVCLKEIVEIDPSVLKLSDMPVGWEAWRRDKNDEWLISKNPRQSEAL